MDQDNNQQEIQLDKDLNVTYTQKEIECAKVSVNARAMNRAALGIVHAFMEIYPEATFDDLKSAFPDSIHPKSDFRFKTIEPLGVFQLKKTVEELPSKGLNIAHFIKEEEIMVTGDSQEICVTSTWNKAALEALVNAAKKHGIIVPDFDPNIPFKKGQYSITKLPGFSIIEKKKKSQTPLILLLLIVVGSIGYFIINKTKTQAPTLASESVIDTVSKHSTEVDSLPKRTSGETTIDQLKKDVEEGKTVVGNKVVFDDIYFDFGNAKIRSESDSAINRATALLSDLPKIKIKIIGHTSDEGSEDFNLKLSEKRAKAIMDLLIKKGISKDRLTFEGKGKSAPKFPNDTEDSKSKNRRTEFLITEQ